MRLFFFGMGYSSRATARALHLLADPAIPVAGTTRSTEAAESMADSAYRIHVFDGEVPGTTLSEDLRQATHVILSIPPDERGDPALNLHRADLDAAPNLEWIGYFSTVGVYGDFGGEWIDEDAPTGAGEGGFPSPLRRVDLLITALQRTHERQQRCAVRSSERQAEAMAARSLRIE